MMKERHSIVCNSKSMAKLNNEKLKVCHLNSIANTGSMRS